MEILKSPIRDYVVASLLSFGLIAFLFGLEISFFLYVISFLASIPIFFKAVKDILVERKITIEVFNSFVLIVAFSMKEPESAGFIVLMLTFANYLDWKTETRSSRAIEELLKLNPLTAIVEKDEKLEEVTPDQIKEEDILVIKDGSRVPVDGVVVYGSALLNESSVSGESMPIEKVVGDKVYSSTLNESGLIKIKALGVGKNSTIERMVELIKSATLHKSRSEKLADRFAGIFMPVLLFLGIGTYYYTRNLDMVLSLFLVACADDMAVAIPLAMTASLGKAARRGVIIKGGEWLDVLAKMDTLIFDKTGTLTYGTLKIESSHIFCPDKADDFWMSIAVAEKFSEHPAGRALYREAAKRFKKIPDPEDFKVVRGGGVYAKYLGKEIIIGNENIFNEYRVVLDDNIKSQFSREKMEHKNTTSLVYIDKKFEGVITVSDITHQEAKKSIIALKNIGIKNIKMFTGDNEEIAKSVSYKLGIEDYRSKMTPESKLLELEKLSNKGIVGMVGDGINDAPALARANVGIAMGDGGTAVAIEAADVVILSSNLKRIPEIIKLSRKTMSVIHWDMLIWALSNFVGFSLVFAGLIGPVLAAFYNFVTDFIPLFNSARLFREEK